MYTVNRGKVMRALQMGVASMLLLVCFSGCGQKQQAVNFFAYAIRYQDQSLSPQKADFGLSPDEVISENKLDAAQYSEDEKRIVNHVTVACFSKEIIEVFNFDNDSLVSVQYTILVDDADFENVCNMLYNQANEYMPEPDTVNSDQGWDGTETIMWMDEAQNSVIVSFATTANEGERAISITISAARKGGLGPK